MHFALKGVYAVIAHTFMYIWHNVIYKVSIYIIQCFMKIQLDVQYSLFLKSVFSTCFGCHMHPSGAQLVYSHKFFLSVDKF
jgi:hypothetical protein